MVPICRYMDQGAGPTPRGLERALRLLAEGAPAESVLPEVVQAAVRSTGCPHALAIGLRGGAVTDLGTSGVIDPSLRSATAEALSRRQAVRRSNPVAALHAIAVPVNAKGVVVGALGVAGASDRVDLTALSAAADLIAVCLSGDAVRRQAESPLDALSTLASAAARPDVVAATLEAVGRFTSGPAFVCLEDGERLRVARYHGIAHEELAQIVARNEFVEMLATWRDRPTPPAPETFDLAGHGPTLVAAALHVGPPLGRPAGAVVVIVAPSDAEAARRLLASIIPHVSAGLGRAHDEVELRRRERELDALTESHIDPIVVLDGEGSFLRVNAAACELLGLSASFDCGRPARGRFQDDALEHLIFETDGPGEVEIALGVPGWEYQACVTRVNDGPTRLRTIIAFSDISARQRHEQALDEFVSVIGHELRTPLTVAKGFVETVLGHPELAADQRDLFLGKSLAQTERLEDLINDLLFISTERRTVASQFVEHDVIDVVATLVARFRQRHPDRSIECVPLSNEAVARTDPRLLTHALRHLVDNAIKYSEGPVSVEISAGDGGIEVAVTDQGPGIFSGNLERLFKPFEQLDSSSTRHQGGVGLGLYLSRRLVDALGGRLDCDSRLGQGSRFSFRLRGADAEVSPPARVRDDARS